MTRTQPTPFPSPDRRTRISAFATVATVAVVALAVVGGGALLLNQGPANGPAAAPAATATQAPTPTAIQSTTAMSDEDLVAALAAVVSDPYDATRVAALYAPNAVIRDLITNTTQLGLEEIGAWIQEANRQKFKVVVTSAPIRQDNFVAFFHKMGNTLKLRGRGLLVCELEDGKVLNQWVYNAASSPVSSPPAVANEALLAELAALATSPYNAAKSAALYAPDAVLYDEVANETHRGLAAIQAQGKAMDALGVEIEITSAWIGQDNFVAHFVRFGNTSDLSGRSLMVYELKDGKIVNQWAYDAAP